MKQLLLMLCALSIVEGKERFILNGRPAEEGQFPYQAYLTAVKSRPYEMYCGASIIHKRWLLTAAHCDFTNNNTVTSIILVGTINVFKSRTKYEIEKFIIHESYSEYDLQNDIALIRVKENIRFNDKVKPIKLPKEVSEKCGKKIAIISGWGGNKDNETSHYLNYILVQIVPQSECENAYMQKKNIYVYETMICTSIHKGKGTYYGDSGGPVVIGKTQVGIVSSGIEGFPDLHTRVSKFLPWIRKQMKLYDDKL